MRSHDAGVLSAIRDSKDLSADTITKLKEALEHFGKTFA
jgi:F-type H+-transporting ATPase subunit alpha